MGWAWVLLLTVYQCWSPRCDILGNENCAGDAIWLWWTNGPGKYPAWVGRYAWSGGHIYCCVDAQCILVYGEAIEIEWGKMYGNGVKLTAACWDADGSSGPDTWGWSWCCSVTAMELTFAASGIDLLMWECIPPHSIAGKPGCAWDSAV